MYPPVVATVAFGRRSPTVWEALEVSIKKWFGQQAKSKEPRRLSVDDLMILERWDEAESMLKERLKRNSRDVQAQLKMAKLHERTRRSQEAAEEYALVAERYAADGHFEKSMAMLAKASKLAPGDPKLRLKLEAVERLRNFEQRLSAVMRSLSQLEGQVGVTATSSYLELRRIWGELAVSDLIDRLDNEQLGRLLKVMELVRVGRGRLIAERGQRRDELYLVTRGKLNVELELPNGETTVIRSMDAGDVVGESALLERKPWPAIYRTAEPVVILKLDRPGLETALQGNPDPRRLLDALREQSLDAKVEAAVLRTLQD